MKTWILTPALFFLAENTRAIPGGITRSPEEAYQRAVEQRQDDSSTVDTSFIGYYVDNNGKVSTMRCSEGSHGSWSFNACRYTTIGTDEDDNYTWKSSAISCLDGAVSYSSTEWLPGKGYIETDGTYPCANTACVTMTIFHTSGTYVPATPTCDWCGTMLAPSALHALSRADEFITCLDSMGLPPYARNLYKDLPTTSPASPTPNRPTPTLSDDADPTAAPDDDDSNAEPDGESKAEPEDKETNNVGVMAGAVVGSISGTALVFGAYMLGRRRARRANAVPQEEPSCQYQRPPEPSKASELDPEAGVWRMELESNPPMSARLDAACPGPYELHESGIVAGDVSASAGVVETADAVDMVDRSVVDEPASAVMERASAQSADLRRTLTR